MVIRRLFVAVLLLAALGCTTDPRSDRQQNVSEESAEVRALYLPFDRYTLTRLELYTIEYAEDLVIRECMRDLGMDWELSPPPPKEDPDPLNRRRYGLIEPQLAADYGYHPPPMASSLIAREAVWQRRAELPLEERRAAYGPVGNGGCRVRARGLLNPHASELNNNQNQLNDFVTEAASKAVKAPKVVDVAKDWSACMAAKGFDYDDPFSALGDKDWEASERASTREITVAVADVGCKQRTDLVDIWITVEEEIQLDLIRAHSAEFDMLERAKTLELETARRTMNKYH